MDKPSREWRVAPTAAESLGARPLESLAVHSHLQRVVIQQVEEAQLQRAAGILNALICHPLPTRSWGEEGSSGLGGGGAACHNQLCTATWQCVLQQDREACDVRRRHERATVAGRVGARNVCSRDALQRLARPAFCRGKKVPLFYDRCGRARSACPPWQGLLGRPCSQAPAASTPQGCGNN